MNAACRLVPLASAMAAALVVTAPSSGASETRESCPVRIHVEGVRVAFADQPARFQSTVDATPLFLSGLNVYDGPPERGAALMPAQNDGGGARSTWRFPGSYPDGKWLSCDYANGLVHVAVRADDAVTSCDGTMKKEGDPAVMHGTFVCR